jgi:hypothetical protein
MPHLRPEVTLRTTTGDDGGQAPTVVAGYGLSPAAAIRDLERTAKATVRAMPAGPAAAYEVLGVQLAAGQVPDNHGERGATVAGWAAYGTLAEVTRASRRAAS